MVIDGKKIARTILLRVRRGTRSYQPNLVIVQIGHRPDSDIYIRQKIRAAEQAGIRTRQIHCQNRSSQSAMMKVLRTASADTEVDGILLQLPLPSHLDTDQLIAAIAPEKDVDGFHPHSRVISPLIQAIELSLKSAACTKGKILLLGRASIFSRALQSRLTQAGFQVTIASGATTIPPISKHSDIIISVRGRGPKILPKHLKKGAVVIDGGIRRYEQKISGDADPSIASMVRAYTPVPGGIGPITVACAIANTALLAKKKRTARP